MEKFYSKEGLYLCKIEEITEITYKHYPACDYQTKYLGYTVCRYSTGKETFTDVFTGTELRSYYKQGLHVREYCVRSFRSLPETVRLYRTESELQTEIALQEDIHNKFSIGESDPPSL